MSRALESQVRLRASIQSVASCLAEAMDVPLPSLGRRPDSVVTTGIGASEAPARFLAMSLVAAGVPARFCEASRFALAPPGGDLLVVFSQGLSPNARLALGRETRFRSRWLVTSVGYRDADAEALSRVRSYGVTPVVAPPESECGMLVRIVGPTVAMAVAMRLSASLLGDVAHLERLRAIPDAYRPMTPVVGPLAARVAFVTAGCGAELAHAHRSKILEGLLVDDPPVWDILQVAHGPLQSFHAGSITLIVLEHPSASALVERLQATLEPDRHSVIRLRAQNLDDLAFFEHAATLDASLEASLAATPRDLFEWPARGRDAPLYGFGSD